jgi:F-box-like
MITSVNLRLFDTLPTELLPCIFINLSCELDNVALVCKRWRQVTNDSALRDMIRPLQAMGIKELKKINPNIVDAGIEHLLPRSAYRDFAEKGGWLVFDPGKVKVKNKDGLYEEIVLNTVEIIGNLCKTKLIESESPPKDKRKENLPHWVLIDTKPRGFYQSFAEQRDTAKEKDKKAYPERYQAISTNIFGSPLSLIKPKQIIHMANIYDLALGMFMAQALLGHENLIEKEPFSRSKLSQICNQIHADTGYFWEQHLVTVHSGSAGFLLSQENSNFADITMFLCARKSFGC